MGLSDFLSGLWSGQRTDASAPDADSADSASESVVYECRNCGTTVSGETRRCPNCGSEEIVEYPVE